MQVKRFFAADMRQAMKLVRDELGADAAIIGNRRIAGGVELTAALDYTPQALAPRVPNMELEDELRKTVAGQIISIQMGMGFASMVDPTNGVSAAVIGQFLTMLVTLLFLAMNGHLVAFEVMTESFTTLPVGSGLVVNHFWEIVGRLGWVFGASLLLVLPAITALLVVNIAFGVMTRAAPQLNIFSIGFPLTLVLGMGIFWIGLADILNQYQPLATDALQFLRDLARAR